MSYFFEAAHGCKIEMGSVEARTKASAIVKAERLLIDKYGEENLPAFEITVHPTGIEPLGWDE